MIKGWKKIGRIDRIGRERKESRGGGQQRAGEQRLREGHLGKEIMKYKI
jgi:hypothetical protein